MLLVHLVLLALSLLRDPPLGKHVPVQLVRLLHLPREGAGRGEEGLDGLE